MLRTRMVAVLFTDMVGSTTLLSELGASAADELRDRHFAEMRSALAVHHGTEVKTLGDGMMAVFESVTDALACAVTMQQASQQNIRIGLSVGEATVENSDYFGIPVVEASRLCAAADDGQILVADLVRAVVATRDVHRLEPVGELTLKGLPAPTMAWEVGWEPDEDSALRVALADDSALLREGIARALAQEGIDVVFQASDAEELLAGLAGARPHAVVVDVRMPPTHTTEGLDAAERIKADYPQVGVLVLSATLQEEAARRLLAAAPGGVGYLLKDSVGEVAELVSAVRTVASGGSVIAPEIVARLQ
ncbi:response regulator [Aeromicrobium terrae]|uniref:Response regulator n=1 Tax=Aeromicrobium terrae TaxID=2498846 RepID=A0A5C8NE69_9ACTN|nr:response regulator [Aeromicrobium terrae]TXL57291.1 response regulator [Aeromicrobium terrae]